MLHYLSVSETTVHDIIFGNETLSTDENKLNMDVIFQYVHVRETARCSTVPFGSNSGNLVYFKQSHNVQPHPDHHTASSYNIIVNYT